MKLSKSAFKSYGNEDTLSDRVFYLILGIMVIIGLVGMGYSAQYSIQEHLTFARWEVYVLGLGVPILGIIISQKSDVPFFSFIGYMMIVVPEGLILGPALAKIDSGVIMRAAWLTGGITLLMTVTSFIKPSLFENLGGALFTALICLIIVRIIQIFIPELQNLKVVDYISAGIFSLYIGYDMYRAQNADRTVDSAIDVAVSLYLDILNLFLSMLSSEDD